MLPCCYCHIISSNKMRCHLSFTYMYLSLPLGMGSILRLSWKIACNLLISPQNLRQSHPLVTITCLFLTETSSVMSTSVHVCHCVISKFASNLTKFIKSACISTKLIGWFYSLKCICQDQDVTFPVDISILHGSCQKEH